MTRAPLASLPLLALLLAVACTTRPADLDLSLNRPTVEGRLRVELVPPAAPAPINQIHSWTVKLSTPAGLPVRQAQIVVNGGMPQHGHGLPTRPRVTRELADGVYLLEGMKFSMSGWWEIKLDIQSPAGADKVTFNTVVDNAAPAR